MGCLWGSAYFQAQAALRSARTHLITGMSAIRCANFRAPVLRDASSKGHMTSLDVLRSGDLDICLNHWLIMHALRIFTFVCLPASANSNFGSRVINVALEMPVLDSRPFELLKIQLGFAVTSCFRRKFSPVRVHTRRRKIRTSRSDQTYHFLRMGVLI